MPTYLIYITTQIGTLHCKYFVLDCNEIANNASPNQHIGMLKWIAGSFGVIYIYLLA